MKEFLFFGLACLLVPRGIAEQRFSSGDRRVSLIELFTSEGCSSCPPAERWLSSLREAPGLWRDFVPLAFHVNYWDQLGWPDRFASRQATQREYDYAAAWGSASVYTPCFARDGAEWRASETIPNVTREKAGILTLTLSGQGTCHVEYAAANPPDAGLEVHVALLGNGFSSRVNAGENRGETLPHDFVVLALETHGFVSGSAEKRHCADFTLPDAKITDASRQALAVWVTRHGEPSVLQATGGWLELRRRGE